MAGTSFLATICAERLAKFLTRYSKVQVSQSCSQLRGNDALGSIRTQLPTSSSRGTVVERKYSLWHPGEKPRLLESIHGFNLGSNSQLLFGKHLEARTAGRQRSFLRQSVDSRMDEQELSGLEVGQEDLAQNSAIATVLAKHACSLNRNRELLKAFDNPYNYLL
ncbi:hypothetical protein ACLKA6_006490 [Drosophila palustris]